MVRETQPAVEKSRSRPTRPCPWAHGVALAHRRPAASSSPASPSARSQNLCQRQGSTDVDTTKLGDLRARLAYGSPVSFASRFGDPVNCIGSLLVTGRDFLGRSAEQLALMALAPLATLSRYVRCMHLRHGVTALRAIAVIDELISASQRPLAGAVEDADLKRHLYLNWVAEAEVRLQEVFSDAGTEDPVLGRGYWHICLASAADARLMSRLVQEELRFQCGYPSIPGDPGGRLGEVRTRLRDLTSLGGQARVHVRAGHQRAASLHALRPAAVGRADAGRPGPPGHPNRRRR